MAYRTNPSDAVQDSLESRGFSGGVPVFFAADTTRVISAGRGGAKKTHGGTGVVVPHNATTTDYSDQAGKRVDSNGRPQ